MLSLMLSCCAAPPSPEKQTLSPIRDLASLEHAADCAKEVRIFLRQCQKRSRVRGLLLVGRSCLPAKLQLARGAAHEIDVAFLHAENNTESVHAAFCESLHHDKAVVFLSDISYKSESFNEQLHQCMKDHPNAIVIAAADSLSSVPLTVRNSFQFRVFVSRGSSGENIF